MERVYIVAAKRTPIGSFNGSLASLSAVDLGVHSVKAALQQAKISPDCIDEVIVGNVLTGGSGMGPGRQVAIKSGIPDTVPAYTLNMICGSGMKAIINGATSIRAGDAEIVLTCGMESMSNAPFVTKGSIRSGYRMGHQQIEDTILKDGLTDAFNHYHMGITAENIARKFNISREEQDQFALSSQKKATKAIKNGFFKDEIAPITISTRKRTFEFCDDEFPKFDCTLEKLNALRPAFEKEGTVTAGNSSGINDGSSAILLASESAIKRHNLTPLAELVEYGQGGVPPEVMGLGPVPAIINTLNKADIDIKNIDVFELNEAFASQSIGVIRSLTQKYDIEDEWLLNRTNLGGGAIALGHPIGVSGNRIVTTLLYHLQRTNNELGLASLCIGGGMGTAVILKRC